MINIKKIISVFIISFFCLTDGNTVIKDSLFATVGNKAVTHSDIVNEMKVISILTRQIFSEDNRKRLQSTAIQSIIKRNIKQIEIEKYTLTYNEADLYKELELIARESNMDVDTFKNTFIANGIDFSNVTDQIRTELLWNSLIFKLYNDRLSINLDEINEQLKSVKHKKEIEEYLISEIIIKPVPNDKIESEINKIKNKINTEGFEKVAIDLSLAESALKGGNLGWISENIISKEFKSKITNTPVGSISEPVFLSEGILLFKVRDKRKLKKLINLEEVKNKLVHAEKTKILNMHSLSHYNNLVRSVTVNYH